MKKDVHEEVFHLTILLTNLFNFHDCDDSAGEIAGMEDKLVKTAILVRYPIIDRRIRDIFIRRKKGKIINFILYWKQVK